MERIVDRGHPARRQVVTNGDRSERQGALHPRFPHATEVDKQRESPGLVRETTFVNQHAAVDLGSEHGILDAVKSHWDGLESSQQP